jgi:hypothetical protein
MVGGVLEYVSLITGYRVLLILVGTLYAAAFGLQRLMTVTFAPWRALR